MTFEKESKHTIAHTCDCKFFIYSIHSFMKKMLKKVLTRIQANLTCIRTFTTMCRTL